MSVCTKSGQVALVKETKGSPLPRTPRTNSLVCKGAAREGSDEPSFIMSRKQVYKLRHTRSEVPPSQPRGGIWTQNSLQCTGRRSVLIVQAGTKLLADCTQVKPQPLQLQATPLKNVIFKKEKKHKEIPVAVKWLPLTHRQPGQCPGTTGNKCSALC